MIRTRLLSLPLALVALALLLTPAPEDARAQTHRGTPTPLTLDLVASVDSEPLFVVSPPGDFDRIFIVGRRGQISVVRNGALLATPFLDLSERVSTNRSERGLLGLAFHPNFATNGLFYVNYTSDGDDAPFGDSVVARFQVEGDPMTDDTADAASLDVILTYEQPFSNHNAGWMGFGPDDFLYIATGDGGGQEDPNEEAQDRSNLLGCILRIDVDADDFPAESLRDYAVPQTNPFVGQAGVRPEIWAYGLRNPFRADFDDATGEFWIVDVGQDSFEEINLQAASSVGGQNYGWDCREGFVCTGESQCDCQATIYTDPLYVYEHLLGRCSITGAAVYRGCSIPDLQGLFFFADFCTGEVWTLDDDGAGVTVQNRTSELGVGNFQATSFSTDALGEVYLCTQSGGVYRVAADNADGFVGPDCNANGVADACDIRTGFSDDSDASGVPDECEPDPCPADFNDDGAVSPADLSVLLSNWGMGGSEADLDASGAVGPPDLSVLLANWGPCPTP